MRLVLKDQIKMKIYFHFGNHSFVVVFVSVCLFFVFLNFSSIIILLFFILFITFRSACHGTNVIKRSVAKHSGLRLPFLEGPSCQAEAAASPGSGLGQEEKLLGEAGRGAQLLGMQWAKEGWWGHLDREPRVTKR